jgi:protein TonB
VRINPKYPTTAARDGIEGWVQLSFNISPTGEVIDAVVLNAEPKRIFNREALRAIKRWKYRPKVIEGVAQLQTDQTVQLDFKLDNSI